VKKQQFGFTTGGIGWTHYTSRDTSPVTRPPDWSGRCHNDVLKERNDHGRSTVHCLSCADTIVGHCGARHVALNGTKRYSINQSIYWNTHNKRSCISTN